MFGKCIPEPGRLSVEQGHAKNRLSMASLIATMESVESTLKETSA